MNVPQQQEIAARDDQQHDHEEDEGQRIENIDEAHHQGIGAPANTPPDIVARLNQEINAALADAKMQARFADLGGTPLPGSPADFGALLVEETEKWGKVVKFSGAKPE